MPIPKSRAGELEGMFRKAAKKEGWEFEDGDADSLLKGGRGREFIKLDLPDGKSLVHFIQGKFNLQFARWVTSSASLPYTATRADADIDVIDNIWRTFWARRIVLIGKSA